MQLICQQTVTRNQFPTSPPVCASYRKDRNLNLEIDAYLSIKLRKKGGVTTPAILLSSQQATGLGKSATANERGRGADDRDARSGMTASDV